MDANQIQNLFASNVRQLLVDADLDYDKLYEIRLRVGRPLFLTYDGGECFLRQKDTEPYLVTREDLKETLEYVSGYSLYAYEDEIRQGFLSVQGGHRVGVTGKVILDGNRIRGMKYISCINVRLAHEIQGCAEEVLPYIQTREQIMHTLIVSPPRCGKTTLLRDIIRQMSNGWGNISGVTVGVVDERSELAGCYQGIPQNDLGMRTDILDGCPKAEGMQMLIRSMSPVVVAVDELGKEEDFKAVESVIHCGCRLIATAHGASMEETLSQPFFRKLVVAAGAGMGFSGSMRLSEQIRILEKLLQMVICLKGEIRCGNASLPDAFYGAAGRMNGKYREFLISAADRMKAGTGEKLSQICRECAESALKKSCLTHGEKDAFFSFGEYLGYMDLEMQMRQLSLYENNLEAEILKRKAEVSGKKKLYQGIGILGGLLLAVLLV